MTIRRVLLISALLLGVAALVPHLWPDEALGPDAQRLLDNPRPITSDPRALSFALYGFEAPAGEDIWTYGQFRVGAYNALGEMPELLPSRLGFTVQTNDFCRLRDKDCWDKMLEELPGLPALLTAQAGPLARYATLHDANSFDEVLPASFFAPIPPYTNLSIGNRLTLRRALSDFETGDVTSAWRALDRELVFHRRMLAGSGSLINKMIALTLVEDEVRLFAALMDRSAPRDGSAARPGGSSLPTTAPTRLTLPERSLVGAMEWEAALMINSVARPADGRAFAALFGSDDIELAHRLLPFKRNATVNRALAPSLALARHSLLPAKEYLATQANADDRMPSALDWYLNGAGSSLLAYGAEFDQYLVRIHDVDALIVLCQIAHRLHTERVTATQVESVLEGLPAELRNPQDGKAALWRDGVLSFDIGAREQKFPLRVPVTLAP